MFPIRVAGLMGSNAEATATPEGSDSYYVEFDGTGDYINFGVNFSETGPNVFLHDQDFSISTWVYFNEIKYQYILTSGNAYGFLSFIGSNSSDDPNLRFDGVGSTGGNPNFVVNTWYHIVCTHDEGNDEVKWYLDGELIDTDSFTLGSTQKIEGNTLKIGGTALSGGTYAARFFNGRMGSLAIYDDILTSGEVSSLYSGSGYDAASIGNCVGWWRMGDGEGDSGTNIADQSTNSNDGTLTNDAVITSGTVG
jgi:hypothetical protein